MTAVITINITRVIPIRYPSDYKITLFWLILSVEPPSLRTKGRSADFLKEDTHMPDVPRNPDTADEGGVGPDRGETSGAPRWVKVFGIIALFLVLLAGIIMVTGIGGQHGPGRHIPSGGSGGRTLLSSVITDYAPSRWGS